MALPAGVLAGNGKVFGEPLRKRTSDSTYVQIFWSPVPFRANGALISPIASWIENDSGKYTALTEAQYEANYTPASSQHNVTGR